MRNWQELLETRLRTSVIRYAPVITGLPVEMGPNRLLRLDTCLSLAT